MLTTDNTNRRDAIGTAVSVLALLGDLMAARAPGGNLTLSDQSASGLDNILTMTRDVLEDADIGLARAATEVAALTATAVEIEAERRQDFNRGHAAGLAENAPFAIPGGARHASIRAGVIVGYRAGWEQGGGDAKKIRLDWRDEIIAAMLDDGGNFIRDTPTPAAGGSGPILTEPVTEGAAGSGRGDLERDEQRHFA